MSNVNLVSMTTPTAYSDCHSAEEFIAYAARVSNPGNQNNAETAPKLLKYLIREGHWSPFEMVSMTIEIKTTRDIAKQILRHRSFSFQEFSQRYAEADEFTTREARLQDPKNRQNSVETEDRELAEWWNMAQKELIQKSKLVYQTALDHGIAKEQARAVLPEGNTVTTLYMAGTLRSWIHYCQLRMGNGTQKEHAMIAKTCWNIIEGHFPSVVEALKA
jgi:thymidylate synthase (FAD)